MKEKSSGVPGRASTWALPATLVAAATLSATLATAPRVGAAFCGPAPNGTFAALSDGAWAKTNDVFHDDETPVHSTWNVSTTCTADFPNCAGLVISSQGWTAPMLCEVGYPVRDPRLPCLSGVQLPDFLRPTSARVLHR